MWLWVSDRFSFTYSNSTLRFDNSYNVPDHVAAFWATCSKNMIICFRVSMEWLETETCWNLKKCGFSIWTSWTSWNDYVVATATSLIETTCSTDTSSIWMLSITWSKLGLGSFSMLPYVTIASSSSPPVPLVSFEHVRSSSSSKSLTSDPKIVLDFFFNGEVICSRLNMSLSACIFIHIFSWWDWHVGKGDVVIKHVGLLSFKNCSLVICSSETSCCCATWHS